MPTFVTSILLVTVLLNSSNMDTGFQYAVNLILELEGGYVDHPSDPGGATKYGISQRSYPKVDIKNLTRQQATEIYKRDYWNRVIQRVDDPRMRIMVFDSAVNHGLSRALNWYSIYPNFNDYLTNRIRFYTSLSTFDTFGAGWMRRVARVTDVANRVQGEKQMVDMLIDNRPFYQRCWSAVTGYWGPVAYRIRSMSRESGGMKLDVDNA